MDAGVDGALGHFEKAGNDRIGHQRTEVSQIGKGNFVLFSGSLDGAKESFPLELA